MDRILGLLKIRVLRGINLAVRDACSSDPYVVITMVHQKLKTRVVKNNCNPQWNDKLTLSVKNLHDPIKLCTTKTHSVEMTACMGEAEIDIKPYVACMKMGLQNLPIGTKVDRVQPSRNNYLANESCVAWNEGGRMTQEMRLRLHNVKCGELDVQIEWINLPGSRGL